MGPGVRRSKCGDPSRKAQKVKQEHSNSFGWISSSFEKHDDFMSEVHSSQLKSRKPVNRQPQSRGMPKKKAILSSKHVDVPWAEKFSPSRKDELAVHHKKVKEVEDWLKENLNRKSNKYSQVASLLLLTGPSGSGKTATIRTLSKELQFEVNEWSSSPFEASSSLFYVDGVREPNDAFTDVVSQSQTTIFNNFLLRANKYPSLFAEHNNRVVLVEEFPNVFLRDESAFHSTLRSFCKATECPLVCIVSDSSIETRLFPKNIQLELKIKQISFNPVAPTMLLKALTRVASSMNCQTDCLESVAADSMGDIRNAINTLQFMSMGGPSSKTVSHVLKRLPKRSKSSQEKKRSGFSERDSSIFLFHALGKILYCKRDTTKASDADQLPPHLNHFARFPLIASPEEVIEKTTVSAENFTLFLHENYLKFTDSIDTAAECASSFSQADAISIEWSGRDVLNEYSTLLAARGLMFNLNALGSHSRWEVLHKPQFFSTIKNNRNMSSELRLAFKETRLNLKELETELIPYLYKLRTPLKNAEQARLVSQLGQIAARRFPNFTTESLSSREAVEDRDVQQDDLLQSLDTTDIVSDLPTEASEEIVIEESDFDEF